MKKFVFILLIAVFLLPMTNLAAQQGSFTLLSFDIGQAPIIDVDDFDDLTIDSLFGINFRVADRLTIGFTTIGGYLNYLNAKFDVLPQVRAVLALGAIDIGMWTNEAVAGLGFEIIPFRRQIGGIFTEFKLAPMYFWPGAELGEGYLAFPLTLGIGF